MDEKLVQFVEHARGKGLDHAGIRQLLLSAGWKDRDITRFCAVLSWICPSRLRPGVPRPVSPEWEPSVLEGACPACVVQSKG